MLSKRYKLVVLLLAIYALTMGAYEYACNNAPLENVLTTLGLMTVVLVALFLVMKKKEELRQQRGKGEGEV